MAEQANTLAIRIVSALVLAPIVIAAAYFGGIFWVALVLLCAGLMAWEWSRLVLGEFDLSGVAFTASVLAAVLVFAVGWTASALIPVVIGAAHAVFVTRRESTELRLWLLVGIVYLPLAAAALLWLRQHGDDGLKLIGWLVAVVWATDTAAYAFGRTIGGPRLAPAISPQKTWAGLIGGIVAAAAVGWISFMVIPIIEGDVWLLVLVSATLGIVAQGGDLFVSLLKRRFGAKDASRLIPGHGGVLDRADGLLSAAIGVAVFVVIWELLS